MTRTSRKMNTRHESSRHEFRHIDPNEQFRPVLLLILPWKMCTPTNTNSVPFHFCYIVKKRVVIDCYWLSQADTDNDNRLPRLADNRYWRPIFTCTETALISKTSLIMIFQLANTFLSSFQQTKVGCLDYILFYRSVYRSGGTNSSIVAAVYSCRSQKMSIYFLIRKVADLWFVRVLPVHAIHQPHIVEHFILYRK